MFPSSASFLERSLSDSSMIVMSIPQVTDADARGWLAPYLLRTIHTSSRQLVQLTRASSCGWARKATRLGYECRLPPSRRAGAVVARICASIHQCADRVARRFVEQPTQLEGANAQVVESASSTSTPSEWRH